MTVAQKMRVTAGVFYTVLCLYQMFLTYTVVQQATPAQSSFVWLADIALMAGAAVMALWMFARDGVFSGRVRAAVAVGTGLVIAFQLLHWVTETTVINYTLSALLPSLVGQSIFLYFFVVFRLLLLVLGAFFVLSCAEGMDYKPGSKEKGDGEAAAVAAAKPSDTAPDLDKPLDVAAPEDEEKPAAKKQVAKPE